ncbi:MAG: carboxypeptidase regulatory-like domain-containing protein [Bryobacteraceae bacterium]
MPADRHHQPAGAVLCLLALSVAGSLAAQPYTQLSGSIHDPSGAAVPEAAVTVVSQDTGFRRITTSGDDGRWNVSALLAGSYKITVRRAGFRTVIRYGVAAASGEHVQVDFSLPIGGMHEVVTITDDPVVLETGKASAGSLVDRSQIENLPVTGRGLPSLIELAPGTLATPATRGESGQFSVSGQRPNTNYFTVDGVSANTGVSGGGLPAQATGGSLPGLTALGSMHGLITLEALREVAIETSTAGAQAGRLPGAHVSLSSRAGSNQFHGSMFGYGRDDLLDANNWFANRNGSPAADSGLNDFGAALGGPIARNRTFFHADYEGMRVREPFAWQMASPTAASRLRSPEWLRPALDLFPLPNGPELGSGLGQWRGVYTRRSRLDAGALRLDQAIGSRVKLFARYQGSVSTNEYTTGQVNDLWIRSGSMTGGATVFLTRSVLADFRFNRTSSLGKSGWGYQDSAQRMPCLSLPVLLPGSPGYCDSLFRFSVAGVGQAVLGREGDQRQTQWHFLPSVSVNLAGHSLRVGFDYRRYLPDRHDHTPALSLIAESLGDLADRPKFWVATSPPRILSGLVREYAMFAHDSWRIHPRFTAVFGMRWEHSPPPGLHWARGTVVSTEAYAFAGQNSIWAGNGGYLAPRLGAAWTPFRRAPLVIRGGWGIYYDSSLSIATDLINGGPLSMTQFLNSRNAPFSTLLSFGFEPNLRLPAVRQWNVSVEAGSGPSGVLTVGYVGASGARLLRREFGAFANSATLWLALATNRGESAYHSLQVQYRRPMRRGLQIHASYAWGHAIDNSSSDSVLHWVGPGAGAGRDRGSADFDVRHAASAAVTWEPGVRGRGWLRRAGSGWAIDTIVRARAGFPVNPLNAEYALGLGFGNAFRPDLIAGQPVWLEDAAAPAGRRLNPAAFGPRAAGEQGSLGRNVLHGFGMQQVDLAVRREFRAGERARLALRLEAFNVANHPNFADPSRYLSSPLFGESPSMLSLMMGTGSPGSGLTPMLQPGGSRSVQASIRFRF